MKSLSTYISEKFLISNDIDVNKHFVVPKSPNELRDIIFERHKKNKEFLDLTDIDISMIGNSFSNSNGVTIFGNCYCSQVKEIDVTGWDTSGIKNMNRTFSYFDNLKVIHGIEDWDVSNVTDFRNMFTDCCSLSSKYFNISKWNVQNRAKMTGMFWKCKKEIMPSWYNKEKHCKA